MNVTYLLFCVISEKYIESALYITNKLFTNCRQGQHEMAGHIACMGGRGGARRVLVVKPEGKRLRGRPRRNGRAILNGS